MRKHIGETVQFVHDHVMFLNNSKFFAGIVMILLNVGSKFITIQFSKSTEEYLKLNVTKQLLVFAMAWMGTRDIYTSLILTAVFTILSDHLFNEESPYCVVPHEYRVLDSASPSSANEVTDQEMDEALAVIARAKKEQALKDNKKAFASFGNYTLPSTTFF